MLINSYDLKLLNTKFPTRESTASTLIDHIFSNNINNFCCLSVSTVQHDISDHNILPLDICGTFTAGHSGYLNERIVVLI